jgi:hypothetical protein
MHAGASRVPDLDERQQHAKARVGSSPGRYIIALVCRRFPVAELRWIFAPGGCGDLLPIREGTPCSRRTSVAAAHIAALGSLVLAHGADFQQEFAPRNARKVERLFQILKGTRQTVGDPVECGAGVHDAVRALGLRPQAEALVPPTFGLNDMRNALRFAGLQSADGSTATVPEQPRGPAVTTRAPLNLAPPSIGVPRPTSVRN